MAHRSPWLKPVRFPDEMNWFLLVSALDATVTYILLSRGGFRESNPVALFFIHRWGFKGMFYFKLLTVTIVAVACHFVSFHKPALARRVLQFGTLVVGFVVVYSVWLFFEHGHLVDLDG